MATSLGTLLLELRLDATTIQRDLAAFQKQAQQLGKNLDKNLKLVPEVDHKPLTGLNEHLDLKKSHVKQLNEDFKRSPLKVQFDETDFDRLERRLKRIANQSINVGIASSGGSIPPAGDFGQFAEQIGQSVAQNMQPSALSRAAGAVAAPAKLAVQLAGGAIGNVAGGLTLGITQELTKNLGQGLSRSIERSISSVIGSTSLAGEKLGDSIASSIAGAIQERLPANIQDTLTEILEQSIGADNILKEGLFIRGEQREEQERRRAPVRTQATAERKDALRRIQETQEQITAQQTLVEESQAFQERYRDLIGRLGNQRRFRASAGLDVTPIDRVINSLNKEIQDLIDYEGQTEEKIAELNAQVEKLRVDADKARLAVSLVGPDQLPDAYRQAVMGIAPNAQESQIPKLMVADAELQGKGARALYGAESNTIKITSELKQALDDATLSMEDMLTIAEEIAHARDFGFGSTEGVDARRRNQIIGPALTPTASEMQMLAPELAAYSPEERGYELNAKVAALRYTNQTMAQQQKEASVAGLTNAVGYGGLNAQKVAQSKLAQIRAQIAQITSLSEQMGDVLSDSATTALDAFWNKTGEFAAEINSLVNAAMSADSLSVEEIDQLQEAFAAQFNRLEKIQIVFGAIKSDALKELRQFQSTMDEVLPDGWGNDAITQRTRKGWQTNQLKPNRAGEVLTSDLSDPWENTKTAAIVPTPTALPQAPEAASPTFAERTQNIAYRADQAARAGVDFAQSAVANMGEFMQSPTAQGFIKQTASAARAMGMVAGGAYKVAQGIEGIALDLIPMGRTLKGVGQQIVLPAATFGAATHFLPGGQMLGEGINALAQGAIAPAAQGIAGNLSGAAGNLIHTAVPGFLQANLTTAVTGAIDAATAAITQGIATAGAAVVGGKVIQNAVTKPLQLPLNLPASQPQPELALPGSAPKVLSAATSTIVPAASGKIATRASNAEINKMAAQMTGEAIGNAVRTVKDLLDAAKAVEQKAQDNYKALKAAIKSGDVAQVEYLSGLAEKAKSEVIQQLDDLLEFARDGGASQFGADALTKLGGAKGRVTQGFNRVQQETLKFRNKQPAPPAAGPDELESKRIDMQSVRAAATSDTTKNLIKDLIVNGVGFAVSKVAEQHGMVAGLGGDLMGALVARQAVTVSSAGRHSYNKLKEDEAFQSAKALEKFSMLLNEINQKLQSEAVQVALGNELSGDLMGFAIGNATNAATGIPLSGAAAASAIVPRLQQLRQRISGNTPDNLPPDELESARLLEFNKLQSQRGASPEQIEQLRELNNLLSQAIKASDQFDAAYSQAERESAKAFEEQSNLLQTGLKALENGDPLPPDLIPPEPEKMLGRLGKMAGVASKALLGLTIAGIIAPVLMQVATASSQAALEFQAFSRGVGFVSRNSTEAITRIDAIAESADRLGLSLRQSRESFVQFASSTRGTSLEGAPTDRVFQSIQTASSAMQLDPQRQGLVIQALGQIASKGTVSMEELRGQLSESLPGAMNIAARAMGMTTSELNAFVASGQLASDVFLPKFAQQLQADMGLASEKAADSVQGSFNRMDNAVLKLQETIGAGILPVQKIGADVAVAAFKALEAGLLTLAAILPGLAAMLGSKLLVALVKMAGSVLTLANVMGLFAKGIAGVIPLIRALLPMVGSFVAFAAKFAVFQLIAEIVIGAFSDMSRGIKEFADSSEQNLNRYLEKIGELRNTQDIQAPKQKPESFLGDRTFIGGLFDFFDPNYGKATLQNLEDDFMRMTGQQTYSERLGANQQQQFTRIDSNTQRTMDTAVGVMNNELEKQIALERQLVDLQTQRRGLLPGEVELRQQLTRQEQQLREELENSSSVVAETRTQIEAQIKTLEESINTARQNGAQPTDVRYMEARLKQLKEFQEDFNKRGQQAIGIIQSMGIAFSQVAGQVKAAAQAIEMMTNQANTLISNAAASGQITQGTAEYTRRLVEQEAITRKIAANQEAIARQRNLLESSEGSRVLQVQGLSADTSTDEIRNRAGIMSEGNDRTALEQYAEQLDQLRTLEGETSGLLSQLASAQEQAMQAVRDFSQQANDYFRGIARATEELRLTIKQNDLQRQINQQQARVIRAIGGFTDEFFGGVTSALEEFFSKLNEVIQNKQQQQLQELQLSTGFQDTLRQGQDLSRSAPSAMSVDVAGMAMGGMNGAGGAVGGRAVRFQGIQVTAARDGSGEPGLDYVVSGGRRGAEFGALAAGQVTEVVRNQNWESRLEAGGTRRGYGNRVIVRTVDQVTGEFVDMLYAHLDDVAVQVGQQVGIGTVLGTQGRTGSTTGAHVSVDFFGKDSNRPTRASLGMRDRTARELQAGAPRLNSQIGRSAAPQQQRQRQMPAARSPGRLPDVFAGDSGSLAARIVGLSEGTRTLNGGFTRAAGGHTDPGNGVRNMGSFSYQHGARSAPEADRRQIQRLRAQMPRYQAAAQRAGLDPNNPQLLFSFLDFWTQSPRAADDFLTRLPALARQGLTQENIVDHRVASFGGQFSRRAFGNEAGLRRDQNRRQTEIMNGLRANGLTGSPLPMQPSSSASGASVQGINIQAANTPGLSDIARGQGQATRNLNEEIQSTRALTQSENDVSLAEADRAYQQFQQQLIDSGRRMEQVVRDSRRQAEDILADALPDTPMNRFNRTLQEVARGREDAIREMTRSIESGQQSLAMLQRYRMAAQQRVTELEQQVQNNPELAPQLENARNALALLDKQIVESEQNLKALGETAARLPNAFDARRQQVQDNFRREQEQMRFDESSRVFETGMDVRQAQVQGMQQQGFDVLARPMQRQMAVDQLNFDFSNQIRQLNEMVRTGQMAADSAAKIRVNLEQLNQVNLDNVNTQFDVWRSEVLPGVQKSFQGLFSGILRGTESLQDLLSNFFGSIADQLAQLASQWLTNELFGSLFGMGGSSAAGGKSKFGGMGKDFSGIGGSGGGLLGGLLSGGGGSGIGGMITGALGGLLGFADGGVVPAVDHSALMGGNDAIAVALRKEQQQTGRKAALIVASEGELILTPRQAAEYQQMQRRNIPNFADGGVVGGGTVFNNSQSSSSNINIPITINSEPGSQQKIDVNALRGVIIAEMQRQKRDGGMLKD